jgi:hypothetical protein
MPIEWTVSDNRRLTARGEELEREKSEIHLGQEKIKWD